MKNHTSFLIVLLWTCPAFAQVPIYTGQYNLSRTSANLSETILTPSNVNPTAFGLLVSPNAFELVQSHRVDLSALDANTFAAMLERLAVEAGRFLTEAGVSTNGIERVFRRSRLIASTCAE